MSRTAAINLGRVTYGSGNSHGPPSGILTVKERVNFCVVELPRREPDAELSVARRHDGSSALANRNNADRHVTRLPWRAPKPPFPCPFGIREHGSSPRSGDIRWVREVQFPERTLTAEARVCSCTTQRVS